jgi:hypothetical protein
VLPEKVTTLYTTMKRVQYEKERLDITDEETVESEMMTIRVEHPGRKNAGKLLIETTCIPQDIQYPTDVRLLNDVREKTEKIIDVLYVPHRGEMKNRGRIGRDSDIIPNRYTWIKSTRRGIIVNIATTRIFECRVRNWDEK